MMEGLKGSFICRFEECRIGIVTIVLLLKWVGEREWEWVNGFHRNKNLISSGILKNPPQFSIFSNLPSFEKTELLHLPSLVAQSLTASHRSRVEAAASAVVLASKRQQPQVIKSALQHPKIKASNRWPFASRRSRDYYCY